MSGVGRIARLAALALVSVAPELSGCSEACASDSDRNALCSDDHSPAELTVSVVDDATCSAVAMPSFTQGGVPLSPQRWNSTSWRMELVPSASGVRRVRVVISAPGYQDAEVDADLLVQGICCLLPGEGEARVRLVALGAPDGGVSDELCF